jgi:hypothetical protein
MTSSQHSSDSLRLDESQSVAISHASDLYRLLEAIDVAFPRDATLYIEGTSIAPELKAFLELRGVPPRRAIARGTAYPAPRTFHLPLGGRNLADLRALAENHAGPEICDHLAVYRDDELLLTAYDAANGEVNVARSLPESVIHELRHSLGES